MGFLVEKLDAEISASTRESSGGSAMVITPRVTLSPPRTWPSPNMCLVTNVTADPAGSMAYRPTGGACTAVLVVDMTAAPFGWDHGGRSPGRSRRPGVARRRIWSEKRAGPAPHAVPSLHTRPNEVDTAILAYLHAQASK